MKNKLDEVISQTAYILDSLRALRNIYDSGDCNTCQNRNCGYIPKVGQLVRYNCPFFKRDKKEDLVKESGF